MSTASFVDGVRTPIGRYGGALSAVRPDDLAAHVLRVLRSRHPSVDWPATDDVILGCVNQAGGATGTWPGWPCCSPGCPTPSPARQSTACAARALRGRGDRRARQIEGRRGGPGAARGRGGEHEPRAVRSAHIRRRPRRGRAHARVRLRAGLAHASIPSMPRRVRHRPGWGRPPSRSATEERGVSRADQDAFAHALASSGRPRPPLAGHRFDGEIAPVTVHAVGRASRSGSNAR